MRYLNITGPDIENGLGFRVSLWISGCSCHCPGCHNPESHSFSAGQDWNEEAWKKLEGKLDKPYIKGLTFTGGNPIEFWSVLLGEERAAKMYRSKTLWDTGAIVSWSSDDVDFSEVVTYNLDNVVIANRINSVVDGESLNLDLSISGGNATHHIHAAVTMGGVDITSSVFSYSGRTATIAIAAVTGDVYIQAWRGA